VALSVVVALAVDPAPKPRLGEQLLLDLPLLAELDLGLEDVDLARERVGHACRELLFVRTLGHRAGI
jgi:hypothetical protein